MSTAAKGKKEEPEKKPRRRVKKVAGHGGHHGGSWKVAYADFVTAMMALFLVLWLLSQADTKLKQSVANYFRSPGVFSSTAGGVMSGPKKASQDPSADAVTEQNMFNDVATKLKQTFAQRPEFSEYKDRIKVQVTDEGLNIQIIDKADRVTFESGSAKLNPEARAVLAEIAKAVCALPNPVAIGGHTDKHLFPEGSNYTNWELSSDRANAARRALESNCVKPEQVRRVIGYADTELLYPNQPFAPANRRINITLLRLHETAKGAASGKPEVVEKPNSTEKPEADNTKDETPVEKGQETEKAAPKRAKSTAEESAEETNTTPAKKNPAGTKKASGKPTEATAPAKPAAH